jgi:hypothetical protein
MIQFLNIEKFEHCFKIIKFKIKNSALCAADGTLRIRGC